MANRKDTNGLPLFNGLAARWRPFWAPQTPAPDYTFEGLLRTDRQQRRLHSLTLDGDAAFMFRPQRDGVYHAAMSTIPNTRQFGTDAVITDPALVTGDNYTITFSAVGPGATTGTTTATYTITNTTTGIPQPPVTVPDFPSDKPVTITVTGIPGLSVDFKGMPANGDTATLEPSASIFSVVDTAIREVSNAADSQGAARAVGRALANIDRGLERLQTVRGNAGELLNRRPHHRQPEARSIQLEADRSRAEDLDMIKGISDFQNQQVGYEAALKSYSMVQKLSLFNFIS